MIRNVKFYLLINNKKEIFLYYHMIYKINMYYYNKSMISMILFIIINIINHKKYLKINLLRVKIY